MKKHHVSRMFWIALILLVACLSFGARLKDIAIFRGARDNQLFGVGIVVGLAGTGDSGTAPSALVANMLKNFGVNVTANDLKSKNTALVMVVADIPAFYKEGMRLDVVVSALGSTLANTTLRSRRQCLCGSTGEREPWWSRCEGVHKPSKQVQNSGIHPWWGYCGT